MIILRLVLCYTIRIERMFFSPETSMDVGRNWVRRQSITSFLQKKKIDGIDNNLDVIAWVAVDKWIESD